MGKKTQKKLKVILSDVTVFIPIDKPLTQGEINDLYSALDEVSTEERKLTFKAA